MTMFIIQAAVTIVTAGLAVLFGLKIGMETGRYSSQLCVSLCAYR